MPIDRSAASLTCERASAAPQRIGPGFPGVERHLEMRPSVVASTPSQKGWPPAFASILLLLAACSSTSVQRSWDSASGGNLATGLELQGFALPCNAGDFGRAGDGVPRESGLPPRTARRVRRGQWRRTELRLATWLVTGRRGAVVHEALPGDQT